MNRDLDFETATPIHFGSWRTGVIQATGGDWRLSTEISYSAPVGE
ncbi:MAG: hypothetical protein ACLP4V_18440 [Methylocella sp.]